MNFESKILLKHQVEKHRNEVMFYARRLSYEDLEIFIARLLDESQKSEDKVWERVLYETADICHEVLNTRISQNIIQGILLFLIERDLVSVERSVLASCKKIYGVYLSIAKT